MPTLMRQVAYPVPVNFCEHAYHETVRVLDGKCLVDHPTTVLFLNNLGYQTVADLDSEEDLMAVDPGHALALARQGLGPLKKLTATQINNLQNELDAGNYAAVARSIELEEDAVAPEKTIFPRPNGLTGADAMRLIGIPNPMEPQTDQNIAQNSVPPTSGEEVPESQRTPGSVNVDDVQGVEVSFNRPGSNLPGGRAGGPDHARDGGVLDAADEAAIPASETGAPEAEVRVEQPEAVDLPEPTGGGRRGR